MKKIPEFEWSPAKTCSHCGAKDVAAIEFDGKGSTSEDVTDGWADVCIGCVVSAYTAMVTKSRLGKPRDDAEHEAFALREKTNLGHWCGKQRMHSDEFRLVLCTRAAGHDGDHVSCCEDSADGRKSGMVIARWSA